MPTANYTEVEASSFNPWITLKKFFTGLAITLLPIILLYAIDFVNSAEFPVEYALYIPIIVGILHALLNLSKHYSDTKIVKVDSETGLVID